MSLTAQSGIAARLVPIPPSPSFFHWTGNPGFRKGTPRFAPRCAAFAAKAVRPAHQSPNDSRTGAGWATAAGFTP